MSDKDVLAQLRDENQRLKRAVEELSILNELSRTISASLNSTEIMNAIVRRSLKAVHAEQGVITLVDNAQADSPMQTLIRAVVSTSQHEQFHANQALLGWMHLNKKPIIVNHPKSDERFQGVPWDPSIRNFVCVPLMVKAALRGVLTVYNKKEAEGFVDDDQRLLAIIAAQSAQVIENARLYEQEKAFLRIQEEVRLAGRIQTDLLPKTNPSIPGYDVAGKSIPAQAVGGDYFDFIRIDERRIVICLGDVSGKGLPASLLMANTQATLHTLALDALPAGEYIRRANQILFQNTSPEKFVTMFLGILDSAKHTFEYCCAGHDNPFFFSGTVRRLGTGGIVLGMLNDFPYEQGTISLEPGDTIVMYSDGITEAMNSQEEEFSEQRLLEFLQNHRNNPSATLLNELFHAVNNHTKGTPQTDDMTGIVITRTG
ncbi:MAG TPA: GAF domain-containing SpoIIE family protein phosphatase [Bacteroidota bacterium]|nr:GAF domain-containing SpoIIE family protein phosphatase [Bacteroidota bacterium]